MADIKYKRILLKLSGEALMGSGDYGIDPKTLADFAKEIQSLHATGVQLGVVIGGGNIFRGAGLAQSGIDRVAGDHMGMLATVMNALAMKDALGKLGVPAAALSALSMPDVCETYTQRDAVARMECGEVVMMAAGTGNPYFTTDSAASLRGVEIQADLMIKATKVDGVYTADPVKDPSATLYPSLSYDDVLEQKLGVMDATAVVLCRDNNLPLRVLNIFTPGALLKVANGEAIGTLVQR